MTWLGLQCIGAISRAEKRPKYIICAKCRETVCASFAPAICVSNNNKFFSSDRNYSKISINKLFKIINDKGHLMQTKLRVSDDNYQELYFHSNEQKRQRP